MLRNASIIAWSLGLLAAAGLSGCAHSRVTVPDTAAALPDSYTLYDAGAPATSNWWTTWNSPELDGLIETALTNGFSIQAAEARLRQAAATARREAADLVPEISLDAGGAYREREQDGVTAETETYSLGLAGSYEIDLWGRVRSVADAARAEFDASREDVRTAQITLAGEVAETWIDLLVQRSQLSLLQGQLETSRKTLDLLELRFRNALSTSLDVFQQRQVVGEVEALIPLAEANIGVLERRLAILLGVPPATPPAVGADGLPEPPPLPDPGLPADLLAHRPDIRAAGYRLVAAGERVQAARAARLPALRLTAGAGYESEDLSTLFDNWLANLAGNLALPLIDGGSRRAEVSRIEALRDERLVAYRQAVFEAFAEVENALVREAKQVEHLAATERQLAAARNGLEEAAYRYRNGLQDYLAVLTQLVSVQRLEREEVARRGQRLQYRVALHRALGGVAADEAADPMEKGSPDVEEP